MTDHVDKFYKWAKGNPLIATTIIIFFISMSLLGIASSAISIYEHITKLRADAIERDSTNRLILVKLEPGSDVELTRLAERLVMKSNVTSFSWGDYLIDAQYYGWNAYSNTVAFSGVVENIKSPVKIDSGDWRIRLIVEGKSVTTQITVSGGDGSTISDLMDSAENTYYYNQWRVVRLRFLDILTPILVSNTADELTKHEPTNSKPSFWARLFGKR